MATVRRPEQTAPPGLLVSRFEREDDIPAIPVPLVVGVTGHRDLVASELPMLEQRVRDFFRLLRERYPGMPLELLSPLAEGADRLVAKVALEFDIRLIVPLPMQRELYLEDFEEADSRAEFEQLISEARVFTLPDWTVHAAADGDARELQYAQLGVFIASHCHILLALWDGLDTGQLGGTAQVIEFHQRDYMPGISEKRAGLSLNLVNDESDLVYHIVCSRESHSSGTEIRPGEVSWFTADENRPRTEVLPQRYHQVFCRIAEFNVDAQAHAERIAEGYSLSVDGDPVPDCGRRIELAFKAADTLAGRFQKRIFTAYRTMLLVAGAAGFCFVAFADLPDQDLMIYPYLAFFAIGISVYFIAQRGNWHRRYLDYRVLAESLRVQFYWAVAGVTSPTPTKYNHDSYMSKQDVELGWIRHVLRFTGRRADALLESPASDGIDMATERWVVDQKNYYGSASKQRSTSYDRQALIGSFCFWTGIAIAVVLALVQFNITESLKAPLMALMGLLPLIAGIRAVYSHKKADMELIKQFGFMHRIMAEAERRLQEAESDEDRREILRAVGETQLDEESEWIMRQRERRPDSQELA